MDNELQVWELIMAASWLVKLVMLLLLVASVASWVIILFSAHVLNQWRAYGAGRENSLHQLPP